MMIRQLGSEQMRNSVHRARRGRSVGRTAWFAAGLIAGIAMATVASVQAQLAEGKPPDWSRAAGYMATIENLVVNLAVDTERSAIGIADLNGRFAGLERRVRSLEAKAAN